MVQPISNKLWDATVVRPNTDGTAKRKAPAQRRPRSARRFHVSLAAVEGIVLCLTLALLIVLAGTAIGERVARPAHPAVISVTIQPGDTLWTLATRYGSPNDYILRRVDRLAAYNHLDAGTRLQPGQVLQVPVENPAAIQN
jgi:nucleoid-associated protein YgaU